MGDAQSGGHGPGRLDVVRGAAQARPVPEAVEPQRHAGDIEAGLEQQQRGGGAVHAAAHGGKDPLGHGTSLPIRS